MVKPLLVALSVILLLLNFIDKDINEHWLINKQEKFDPSLSFINSIDKLEWYADSIAINRAIDPLSVEYFALLEDINSQRFRQDCSHYTLQENWIAALSEKMTGIDLSGRRNPATIMQRAYATRSEQSFLVMEIAHRKEIDFRQVDFPQHVATELKLGDDWYYFDANLAARISKTQRAHSYWKGHEERLLELYEPRLSKELDERLGASTASIGGINEGPGTGLNLFQSLTFLLSKIAFGFPLLILIRRNQYKNQFVSHDSQPVQNLQPLLTA